MADRGRPLHDRPVTSSRTQRLALWLAAAAVVPYLLLKLLWLSGSTIGMTGDGATEEMASGRMVVGNVVTVAMVLVTVVVAVGLVRPWGRRVPGWLVLAPMVGAAGLLAPIVLGLPVGLAVQWVLPTAAPAMDASGGLAPWVFALVYGGFVLLGCALAVLATIYARERWAATLGRAPRAPATWVIVVGGLGMSVFAIAMTYWGVAGPGSSGPQAMDGPAQRTVLLATGVLAAIGFATPLVPLVASRRPQLAWAAAVIGCASTALQGPAQLLLAHEGGLQPAVALVAVLATPAATVYGLGLVAARVRRDPCRVARRSPTLIP
jgi:hypothetical protein